ncbi:MAG: hypothetical protein ACI30J_08940 [Paludibacteraceae bacterium]
MNLQQCKRCAYWKGGDGVVWCQHGNCYTEADHLTHCYISAEEVLNKRQTSLTFE